MSLWTSLSSNLVVVEEIWVSAYQKNSQDGRTKLATNQSLGVIDRRCGVQGCLVLCSLANQTLSLGKRDDRGSDTVTLIVDYDFYLAVLENSHTRVRGTQIDTDDGAIDLLEEGVVRQDDRRRQAHEEIKNETFSTFASSFFSSFFLLSFLAAPSVNAAENNNRPRSATHNTSLQFVI